jgi:hypothetical protein
VAEIHHLYERLTHRYRAGWANLDEHRYLGDVKVLQPKIDRSTDNGYDEGPTLYYRVVLPAGCEVDRRALRAVREFLDERHTRRCSHDYDCCGCAFASVRVKKAGRREMTARVRIGRNY